MKNKTFKELVEELSKHYDCDMVEKKPSNIFFVDHHTRVAPKLKIDPETAQKYIKQYLTVCPRFIREKNVTFVPILYGTGGEEK